MKIKIGKYQFYISRFGIEFEDLIWVYPWNRTSKENRWVSTNFGGYYPSFKAYKELEDNYIRDLWKVHRFPHWNDYENYPDGES